jgi:RimJ/RimL family protein N-acetyltransferase
MSDRMTGLSFLPMGAEDALAIQAWRYDGPYAVYNMGGDGAAEPDEELMDRRSPFFAVRDARGELVGFFNAGTSAQVWGSADPGLYAGDRTLVVGLGLRPDLTGQGLGLAFVEACLAFARAQFAPRRFRLYVLTFNERAIRVYERAGFRRVRVFVQHNVYGELTFLEMSRDL